MSSISDSSFTIRSSSSRGALPHTPARSLAGAPSPRSAPSLSRGALPPTPARSLAGAPSPRSALSLSRGAPSPIPARSLAGAPWPRSAPSLSRGALPPPARSLAGAPSPRSAPSLSPRALPPPARSPAGAPSPPPPHPRAQPRGCGPRHGKHAVCAAHRTATHVQRRRHDVVDPEPLEAVHCAYDVDDRVEGADLVKVDTFDRRVVDGRFRIRQPLEQVHRTILSFLG